MYKRILVPIDGSPTSERGLVEAIKLAKEQQAQIRLLHINDLHVFSYSAGAELAITDTTIDMIRQSGRQLLERAQGDVRAAGVEVSTAMVDAIVGTVASFIVAQAREFKAELIVMGTHGRRGFKRLVLGSDAAAVATLSAVPVLLVRCDDAESEAAPVARS